MLAVSDQLTYIGKEKVGTHHPHEVDMPIVVYSPEEVTFLCFYDNGIG